MKEGMDVADVGAGTGFFSMMLGREVGPSGTVFAVDIAKNFIGHIKKRAKEEGLRYVLAVEAPAIEVRKGHSYWKNGAWHEVKKTGIAQVRQIMTLHKRGNLDEVWWCQGRIEMAFRIQEYFLAEVRRRGE